MHRLSVALHRGVGRRKVRGFAAHQVERVVVASVGPVTAHFGGAFSDQLRGVVSYGMNRGKTVQAADNRTLQQVFISMIYSPLKNVELGAEYIHGRRKTFTPETGTMSRFDLMGRYSF